jgi:hypothetical protein
MTVSGSTVKLDTTVRSSSMPCCITLPEAVSDHVKPGLRFGRYDGRKREIPSASCETTGFVFAGAFVE